MTAKNFPILLADDDEDDIFAAKRVWDKNRIANPLYIVRDGRECLEYLHREGRYAHPSSAPSPGVLLLDLQMPKLGGLSVLKHIRSDVALRRLPVVILTQCHDKEERMQSYELGANAFIIKPAGVDGLSQVLEAVIAFWDLAELPEQ
jgi:CheY-like chemotaxis protein